MRHGKLAGVLIDLRTKMIGLMIVSSTIRVFSRTSTRLESIQSDQGVRLEAALPDG
jgi:hypothetical protein